MSDELLEATVDADSAGTAPEVGVRAPLKEVKLLLPVWGYRFVRQFLEFMLPTLLAPGNLPALAQMLPCRFVLMTSTHNASMIRAHPAWRRLERVCSVEIQLIDDLITDGNHTATITLAYARSVRESENIVDTCFIFLVSDYVVADGSLRNVVARVQSGASAVLAGNFQVVAEEAILLLRRRIDPAAPEIILQPRELVAWGLAHLHPATTANVVNFKLSHNAHTNRLFWRVDQDTLLGRFYLMHMIAIRPEVTDFVVGASCDYSFVPEMCPSGNVVAMTDSDDYLVVEMQPRHHEQTHLRWGPLEPKELADSLAEWATARHRENVGYKLIFHAGEIPDNIEEFIAQSDEFVDSVARLLSASEPHPYRHHHYWIGSIAAHRAMTHQALSKEDWLFILGTPPNRRGGLTGILWRIRFAIFGRAPEVTRWHPRWPDYQLPLKALRRLRSPGAKILLVAEQPRDFSHWLRENSKDTFSIETSRLADLSRRKYLPLIGAFDVCLLMLEEGQLHRADELIERIGPMLAPGGRALVVATNDRTLDRAQGFGATFAQHATRLNSFGMTVEEMHYVPSSRLRWQTLHKTAELAQAAYRDPLRYLIPAAAGGVALAGMSYFTNRRAMRTQATPQEGGLYSSVFIVLRPSPGPSGLPLPRFNYERELLRMRSPPELSYDRRLDLRDKMGLEPLGLTTNQVWHEDPSELASILARYRFVARLLSERHDVGEVGCADAFGTRIVLQEVKKVTVYDADPIFIEDVRRRYREEWPLESHVHDILTAPLPKPHDSIYCLDLIDQVLPEDEDAFVNNLRSSLSREHDILLIGATSFGAVKAGEIAADAKLALTNGLAEPAGGRQPALVSAPGRPSRAALDAETGLAQRGRALQVQSPGGYGLASAAGAHAVYHRTGADLKALLERSFYNVFIFSMVGENVLPGDIPGAQYFFALCCSRK